ncbi:DUF1036 domain-containing protein [Antarctobacter heliothermus]|uniref:Uncharacterized protein n=1 Tax=Antarctobacter heliothermus TaxID=74033 RepID=A0A239DNH7_9RHOB|nr:DUF1036 domain-containing protein [Antarctobacter heliothermus]SNS34036.1 Protein of unknown function [Antarctobacter heliothermus]
MHRFFWLMLCLLMASGAQEAAAQNNNFAVYFKNECWRRIQTAIHVRDMSGNWVTKGWWTLEPGQQAFVATTTNRIFYTYGESIAPISERINWAGTDRHYHIRGSSNTYGFRTRRMDMSNWGTWTERFTCN